ncbi:hypothetical protein CRM22_000218 [Opisthorchis felineus]|uniref:Uncharacterized protein n=1 Tax=Opisthorchis felineus TaxID=147828 RepID=A0A4S2MN08_OPIFE|nr:hypothetical protein CRM22_000218 [Opisthorchis felineus]
MTAIAAKSLKQSYTEDETSETALELIIDLTITYALDSAIEENLSSDTEPVEFKLEESLTVPVTGTNFRRDVSHTSYGEYEQSTPGHKKALNRIGEIKSSTDEFQNEDEKERHPAETREVPASVKVSNADNPGIIYSLHSLLYYCAQRSLSFGSYLFP